MLSRLRPHENSSLYAKMWVYDGESREGGRSQGAHHGEYRDYARVDEGMDGISTRFAFKTRLRHTRRRLPPIRCIHARARTGDPPRDPSG